MMVRREFPDDSVFLEEMVVPVQDTRIDLAVVNGSLHGFEIKSDVDTLRRLPSQRDSYNALFDQITLVAASRHVKTASAIIPGWWGVAIASRTGRRVDIEWARTPSDNPEPDSATVVKLLRRNEIERIVVEVGLCSVARKYYMYELNSMLATNMSTDFVRSVVRSAVKQRYAIDRRRGSCDD